MPTQPYNGFSGAERERAGRVQTAAVRDGRLTLPPTCIACGCTPKPGGIIAHLEDYTRPLDAVIPVCRPCHHAIHTRFSRYAPFADRRDAAREGRLPHQNGVPNPVDVLGAIERGEYMLPR